MRDGLDRAGTEGLGWRMLRGMAVMILLLILLPFACAGIHRMQHPAPLGRSTEAMLRSVDDKIPLGSTVDSAVQVFRSYNLEYDIVLANERLQRFERDALFAGGPVLTAVQPQMTRWFYVWSGHLTLYFNEKWRLVGRRAGMSADSPF